MCSVSALIGEQSDCSVDTIVGFEQVRFASGTVVFEPTTPADHLYCVEEGQVRVYQVCPTDARLLRILGPGEWFGVAALAGSPAYAKRAVVVGATTLRRVPAGRLMQHIAEHPSTATVSLVRELAMRLLEAQEDAARLAFDDCHSRLVKALLRFSGSAAASRQADGEQVVLRITHQQLAQAVGAARETISLALTELREQNLLRTGRNQLVFNPDALKDWFERRASSSGGGGGARRAVMLAQRDGGEDHRNGDDNNGCVAPVAEAAVA